MKASSIRRAWALLALGSAALFAHGSLWAQAYPSKPVKIVVSFAAGGTTDILARMLPWRAQSGR